MDTLCVDLVLELADHLVRDSDLTSLSRLGRTSRRLRDISQPVLYRHSIRREGAYCFWHAVAAGNLAAAECAAQAGLDPRHVWLLLGPGYHISSLEPSRTRRPFEARRVRFLSAEDASRQVRGGVLAGCGELFTPLGLATAAGQREMVKWLLGRGADMNLNGSPIPAVQARPGKQASSLSHSSYSARTPMPPLRMAIEADETDISGSLIRAGAAISGPDWTALDWCAAAAGGNIAAARLILGQEQQKRSQKQKEQPAWAAANSHSVEISEINEQTLRAAFDGACPRWEFLEFLVAIGVSLDLRASPAGPTLLMTCFQAGDYDGAIRLMDMGADPSLPMNDPDADRFSSTLLDNVHLWGFSTAAQRVAMVRALLARGLHADHRACRGESALHGAALRHDHGLMAALLEAGADPALESDQGRTALQLVFCPDAARRWATYAYDFATTALACADVLVSHGAPRHGVLADAAGGAMGEALRRLSHRTAARDQARMVEHLMRLGIS